MRTSGRPLGRSLIVATAAAFVIAGAAPAALADDTATPLAPRSQFTMQPDGTSGATEGGEGIPNIDSVKSTIRAYYNATNGIADKSSSPYITEMAQIEADALASLPAVDPAANKAVVFDADDTTLWTYDMEDGAMKFNFDPTLQATWVNDELFPATPGMTDFVKAVQAKGYAVFGITGRSDNQEAATVDNLTKVGYVDGTDTPLFNADNFFTKFKVDPKPGYLDCGTGVGDTDPTKCTTVEYKAGTRKHIEDAVVDGGLGYDIVLNIGDQFSDLQGGYSDASLKLPNPTYYLPSPNIVGAPAEDAALTPRTSFTMAPDGSSAATEGGEGIPNIDSVKSTIRTYYKATNGIADKVSSPYISELGTLTNTWAGQIYTACNNWTTAHKQAPVSREAGKGKDKGKHQGKGKNKGKHKGHHKGHHKPKPKPQPKPQPKPTPDPYHAAAIVLDADDTTLWTYDMEDAAMAFNFNPTLQNDWVQQQKFAPTPRMDRIVQAAQLGGCTIIGLTGRSDAQKDATIANLNAHYGAGTFAADRYFTKVSSYAADQPAYIHCAGEKCTTIEYKSQTRKHIESDLHMQILGNFGDQFSDLIGGHAQRTYKLPNPTYYLP